MSTTLHAVYILLGGNMGDVPSLFLQSKNEFVRMGYQMSNMSSIYTSEAWGFESDLIFYNQVVCLLTNHNPQTVMKHCLIIETKLGRKRDTIKAYTNRIIDIDILFYDDEIIISDNLTIPHPRLHLRKFCLVPMAELDPDFIHPGLNKSIGTLLLECDDRSNINPYEN